MNSKTLILCLIIIFIAGCEKIEIGRPFDCHMGTNYKVTNDLSFKINSLNDSRCPPNMFCDVPGDVHIFISINLANDIIDTVFYQDPRVMHPYQFGGYGFSLLDVEPFSAGTTASKDITITMIISRI
jgi:hypothetical protein